MRLKIYFRFRKPKIDWKDLPEVYENPNSHSGKMSSLQDALDHAEHLDKDCSLILMRSVLTEIAERIEMLEAASE